MELQKRYRDKFFSIVASNINRYKGFHEPGAEYRFTDLLAYYPFDGATEEERLSDHSGNENNLTLTGASNKPTFVNGQRGTALYPKASGGSSAYVDACLFPDIVGGFTAMSVGFWMAVPASSSIDAGTEDYTIYKNSGGDTDFAIYITPSGRIKVIISDALSNSSILESEQPQYTTAYIRHYVITYRKAFDENGDVARPIIRMFVDKAEKIVSVLQDDALAPLTLLFGGSTRIGTNSALLIDEFRIIGHDLTPEDVVTEYDYKKDVIEFDDFSEGSLSQEWQSSGSVSFSDNNVILANGASVTTNDRIDSRLFHVIATMFVDSTDGASGGADGELTVMLKDGVAEIFAKLLVQYDGITGRFVPVLKGGYNNLDGRVEAIEKTLDISFEGMDYTQYRFKLTIERDNKGAHFYVSYDKRDDIIVGVERWVVVSAKVHVYTIKLTGENAFAFKADHVTSNTTIEMGLAEYEVRSDDNILQYTPL